MICLFDFERFSIESRFLFLIHTEYHTKSPAQCQFKRSPYHDRENSDEFIETDIHLSLSRDENQ